MSHARGVVGGTGIVRELRPDGAPPIRYVAEDGGFRQGRVAGRLVLRPDLDLSAYDATGVVDWLAVELTTSLPVGAKAFKADLLQAGAETGYVTPLDGTPKSATHFLVRLERPTPVSLARAIAAIRALAPLVVLGPLRFVEVSIDVQPLDRSDEFARLAMSALMKRHVLPKRDHWTGRHRGPRWVRLEKGLTATTFPYGKVGQRRRIDPLGRLDGIDTDDGPNRRTAVIDLGAWSRPRHPAPCPVDATLYFGKRDDDYALIRVMDKVIDDQNRRKRTWRPLDVEERRSRIEVQLGPQGLAKLGLNQPEDLLGFKFRKVIRRHLRFGLATLPGDVEGPLGAVITKARRAHVLEVFETFGVLGCQIHETEGDVQRTQLRKDALRDGRKPRGPIRIRPGEQGPVVSYDVLNRLVERGADKLTRAWKR